MRSLLSLWLLCLYTGFVTSANCDFKMPTTVDECVQTITYKVHTDAEATATCKDFFPTNFVKAVRTGPNKDTIECTVTRQFQCDFIADSFPMHDKCYKFETAEVTFDSYVQDNPCKKINKEGGLPMPFSMSQTKFIAMEAHRQGINKFWVNVGNDGKTVEDSPTGIKKGFMLYANPWSVYEDRYWDGEQLKPNPDQKDRGVKANAPHLFFRSRTDYEHNMMQGSFERANNKAKASVVCEYQAKIIPKQGWYCDKMKDGLGMNAGYDEKKKRCLYTTLSKYSMKGEANAIRDFPGCRETPSTEQKNGLDDGSADRSLYNQLTNNGAHRIAVIKRETDPQGFSVKYSTDNLINCAPSSFHKKYDKIRQPYDLYDHFLNREFIVRISPTWADGYPKDECSDFSGGKKEMHSNALAVKNGLLIDVPTAVRLPAICSIVSNVDCGLTPCRADQICKNVQEWNPERGDFAKCDCPKKHKSNRNDPNKPYCEWDGNDAKICGMIRKAKLEDSPKKEDADANWVEVSEGGKKKGRHNTYDLTPSHDFEDNVDRVVVRNGCWMTVMSHPLHNTKDEDNYQLLSKATVGEYEIPNTRRNTINGWETGMDASGVICGCAHWN